MQVYLDESGDLGWRLDRPYRRGGSSRYLALAFLFLPENLRRTPRRVMRSLYHEYGWRGEKKAQSATLAQKEAFCRKAVALIQRHAAVAVEVIVAKKENVQPHIRADANKLYNYMVGLVIPGYVGDAKQIEFIPDERSVKVKSGNSLADYLQIKLWFDHGLPTAITHAPAVSAQNYNLQFIDWIAHCVWMRFEDNQTEPFDILKPAVKVRTLFF